MAYKLLLDIRGQRGRTKRGYYVCIISDKEVAALRRELEKAKREVGAIKAKTRECETEIERLRRERSWGTSFDRQGGGNSADRRGAAASTMGPMWTRGVSAPGGLRQSLPNVLRGIVPKFPVNCSPSEYIAWEQHFEFFIANQGLRRTISLVAPEIAVISCTNNAYLFGQFGEELVLEHRQVWGYISEAAADAPFEISLYECHSISDTLRMMREWSLPLYPAERHLLVAELERVQFMGDEESEIVQFILHQFPERPSHPHALVVGRGFRDGGAVGGGSMPRQQQQLQQRSRGGGIHQHQRSFPVFPPARQARQPQPLQLPSRGIHTSGGDGEHGRNPLSAPATEAVPDTSVFPAASPKALAEAPASSAGAASTAVPAAAPATGGTVFPTIIYRWGGWPGRPLLQMKQPHRRRHRRPAVLFPRLHHLGRQSGCASRLLERRHRTLYRRRHRRPAVLLPRLHHLRGQSWRVSRLLERHHRTWQRRCFQWRSATTTTAATAVTTSSAAVKAVTTTAAAAVTATTAAVTTTPPQPVL